MCPGATTLIARIKDQFKTVEDMETIFKQMDLNCNGKMTKEEMIKAGNFNEQEVDAVFDLGDVDRDGEIDLQEFIGVMQTAAPQAYSQSGEEIEIGKVGVYKVGSGAKCVIWCHDCKGGFFSSPPAHPWQCSGYGDRDRTRQLADKLASSGLMVVVPDLFLGKPVSNRMKTWENVIIQLVAMRIGVVWCTGGRKASAESCIHRIARYSPDCIASNNTKMFSCAGGELIFLSVQSLEYEDNEQKWLETVTDWGETVSSLRLTENLPCYKYHPDRCPS